MLRDVVAEAANIIPADGAAIVRYSGIRRTVVDTYLHTELDRPPLIDQIGTVAAEGWLFRPGCVDDLSIDHRWLDGPAHGAARSWRSLLTVALASPAQQDQLRLFWFSSIPRSLAALGDVADHFARQVSLAVHRASGHPPRLS